MQPKPCHYHQKQLFALQLLPTAWGTFPHLSTIQFNGAEARIPLGDHVAPGESGGGSEMVGLSSLSVSAKEEMLQSSGSDTNFSCCPRSQVLVPCRTRLTQWHKLQAQPFRGLHIKFLQNVSDGISQSGNQRSCMTCNHYGRH